MQKSYAVYLQYTLSLGRIGFVKTCQIRKNGQIFQEKSGILLKPGEEVPGVFVGTSNLGCCWWSTSIMPKHPVCPACQRWRCNECGWVRAAANSNGEDQQQYCSRCRDITNGTVLEVRHSRPDILEIHLTSTIRRTSEISE